MAWLREHVYTNGSGIPVIRKIRQEQLHEGDHKFFWQSCVGELSPGHYKWAPWRESDASFRSTTMYRPEELLAALKAGSPVAWCEGERDADTVSDEWGVTATTTALSAQGTTLTHAEWFGLYLAKSPVVILIDNDDAGFFCGWQKVRLLRQLRHVPRFEVRKPPRRYKDVTEAHEAGLSLSDMEQVPLDLLADGARRYKPTSSPDGGYRAGRSRALRVSSRLRPGRFDRPDS